MGVIPRFSVLMIPKDRRSYQYEYRVVDNDLKQRFVHPVCEPTYDTSAEAEVACLFANLEAHQSQSRFIIGNKENWGGYRVFDLATGLGMEAFQTTELAEKSLCHYRRFSTDNRFVAEQSDHGYPAGVPHPEHYYIVDKLHHNDHIDTDHDDENTIKNIVWALNDTLCLPWKTKNLYVPDWRPEGSLTPYVYPFPWEAPAKPEEKSIFYFGIFDEMDGRQ